MIILKAKLTTRQWMKAAKAWRCYFDLPTDSLIAAKLTHMIEQKVNIEMTTLDKLQVDIKPAFIVDVPNKGKKFSLVIETVTPQQIATGPYITEMIGEIINVTITPTHDEAPTINTPPNSDITERTLKGLHSVFFKNSKFWSFISSKSDGLPIQDEQSCKEMFKKYMRVESCKDLTQAAVDQLREEFNGYVNQR